MDYRDPDLHMRLPWEATAIIVAASIGLPLLAPAVLFFFVEHGRGSRELGLIFASFAAPLLVWSAFAIRSRLRKARNAGESPGSIWKRLGLGFLLLWIPVILCVMAHDWLVAHFGFYLIPTGIFFAAVVVLARAMIPASDS
jgi:hypothetical protein